MLKTLREKGQLPYKCRPIRLTADLTAGRAWTDVLQALKPQMPSLTTVPSKTFTH